MQIRYPRQNFVRELLERPHPPLLLRHPNMRLINPQPALPLRQRIFPLERRRWLPVNPHKVRRVRRILHHPLDVRRYPLHHYIVPPMHQHLQPRTMRQPRRKQRIRKKHRPHPPLILHRLPRRPRIVRRLHVPIPPVEIPDQLHALRTRRPLPIPHPRLLLPLPTIQPKIMMPLRNRPHQPPVLINRRTKMQVMLIPVPQPLRVWLQPRIDCD